MPAYSPSQEGTIPFNVPSIDKTCHTYFKVFGELSSGIPPLVCIHGGPGGGHGTLIPFAELWTRYKIPIILYDQIGCGLSTHLPETGGDKGFWQPSLFIAELENLIGHLKLHDGPGFHLYGRSFGGYIAPAYAAGRPRGLQRLIIASGSASKELSIQSFAEVRDMLPTEHRNAIVEAAQSGDFESSAYKSALNHFITTYLCRTDAIPPELQEALKNMDDDKTVQHTMNGPSPFAQNGSMIGWTTIPLLPKINAPTLIFNGEFDTSGRDIAQVPFFELIPRVRWVTLNGAGHTAHLESEELREQVFKLMGEFLVPPKFDGVESVVQS
ncbi:proline-specific peptidase [Myriangium duriaei CBS 260.36]|uniref:Proline-specific peptidase n=1 Tax=Myriangium duriaei CBS 260.36 TaxID=1168546 RepID=A0A9P4MFV8_9PEZI|nr:proline-specific peptidase [Myriangium duriaei CBS 260.36]